MEPEQQDLFKKTKVVHFKKEHFDIYIGRPSKWGNPFSHKDDTLAEFRVSSRDEAVDKYREYILSNKELMNALPELKNKTLGCWCHPKKCHGDVLAALADSCKEEDENDSN